MTLLGHRIFVNISIYLSVTSRLGNYPEVPAYSFDTKPTYKTRFSSETFVHTEKSFKFSERYRLMNFLLRCSKRQVNAQADYSSLLASYQVGLLFLATNAMYFTKAGKIVMLASRL